MKRRIMILAAVGVLAALAATTIVLVPAGGAWCGGRYLEPGVHLRPPLAHVAPYPPGEQAVVVDRAITTREGAKQTVAATIAYRWNSDRLRIEPLDPATLRERIAALLGSLDGSLPAVGLGPGLRAALPGLLAGLPFEVLSAAVSYSGEGVDRLRAAARPTGLKTVVVGLDGLDWVLLDRLIAEGRCPTFARMKREGAWADFVSHPPVLSPLIWTTMATGRSPDEHGILDFVVRDPASGKDVPITSRFRKVPAFWNILSDVGQRVDVVNWWATYPAEPINGHMISERLFYQLFGIRPSFDDPANVYPPETLGRITGLIASADDVGYDEIRHFADVERGEFAAAIARAGEADNPFDERLNHLRQMIAVTRSVFAIGQRLLRQERPDVLALYVEGTDTVGHRFAHFLPPKLSWVSDDDYRRYHTTMARFYELCDRSLGELMSVAPVDTTWIVLADHGFYTGAARPHVQPDDFAVGAAQWHRMVGVLLVSGPDVRRGKISQADINDTCRTLLWLQGAPISRALLGREITELMRPEWVAEHPPVFVTSYDDLPRRWLEVPSAPPAAAAVDQTRLQELQSLGYLSPGGRSAADADRSTAAPPSPPPPAVTPALEARPTERYNLAKLADQRGDLGAAERYYLEAIQAEPGFGVAMMNLASVYARQEKHDEALLWYTRALETGSEHLPDRLLVEFVDAAREAGRLDRALPALEALRPRWGQTSSFDAARGAALQALGRAPEAEAAYRAALRKNPADASAADALLALADRGAAADVEAILERYFKAVQGDLKRLNAFAVVCLRHRRAAWAERALDELLESDPTNGGLISNLAAALQMQGRLPEAAEVMRRAVGLRPDDGGVRFNYGAILASLGRDEEALEQLDEAARLGIEGPRIVVARAKVLFRLGRRQEARTVLQEGLRRYPGQNEIEELLRIIHQPE